MSETSSGVMEQDATFLTRVEVGRSIEDKERLLALQTLRELKAIIPLNDLAAFHGR